MTTPTVKNFDPLASATQSSLERMRAVLAHRLGARLIFFVVCFGSMFGFLLLCNAHHLGASARMHWDTLDSISQTSAEDPMPSRAVLTENRAHVFDMLRKAKSTDPEIVTRYFLSPEGMSQHKPLEIVRRYYSQIAFWLARTAFQTGIARTHSPTGALVYFELASTFAVSISLSLLFTFAVVNLPAGDATASRLGLIVLSFAAVASQPILLCLARQMMTETAGFMLLVPTLMCLHLTFKPRTAVWPGLLLAVLSGGLMFATMRARYTLGMAQAALVPLVLLMTVPAGDLLRNRSRYAALVLTTASAFIAAVAIDYHYYGPFFMPWVYDEALVRSSRLYFHASPSYDAFLIMVFVNAPLLILPIAGATAWIAGRPATGAGDTRIPRWQWNLTAGYVAIVLCGLLGPLALMARQEVSFQPRHMFTFSAVFFVSLLLIVGRIHWRWFTAGPYALLCLLIIALNVYSTTGPQRTVMSDPWPVTVMTTLNRRAQGHIARPLLYDLADGYFDWSENRRLYDPAIVFRLLGHQNDHHPVVVLSESTQWVGLFGTFTRWFNQPYIWFVNTPAGMTQLKWDVQNSLASGHTVYLVTGPGALLPTDLFDCLPVPLKLDVTRVYELRVRRGN